MSDLRTRLIAEVGHSYSIEQELGGGGMSRVFVAQDRSLGRRVVIKVLPEDLGSGFNIERFRREIRLAATLQHPHIVPLLTAAGDADPAASHTLLYYTMPLVQGESLRARLVREGELPVPLALRILRDVADALAYAHEQGIVHRDIKPDNVLLSGSHAVVTDFGVAKALAEGKHAEGSSLTSAGLALGTPAYMAPEQAAADPQVDHRADIYALGAMGYEMLTGAPPFVGSTPQQVLAAQVTRTPEPVGIRRPSIPAPLAALVMRCLEKSPADRWQTAREIVQELERVVTPSAGTTPTVPLPSRPPRRRVWPVAAGVLLALAGIGGWMWYRSSRPVLVLDNNVIAVLPFRVTGADPTYGEGMVDLLAAKLTGEGGPRATDPQSVMSAWRRAGGTELPREQSLGVARRLGAGKMLLGSVVGTPNQLALSASVFNVSSGKEESRGEIAGSPDSLMVLVDRLAAQVLAGSAGASGHQLRKLTSTSLPALRAYLAGQASYRRAGYFDAIGQYQRALELDSTFALAAIGLASAAHWTGAWDVRDSALKLAERLRTRLSVRDAAFLDMKEAMAGYRVGGRNLASWTDASQRMVELAPDSPEGWYELGDSYFHAGTTLGLSQLESFARADRAFHRSAQLDSLFAAPIEHLVEIAAVRGDTGTVRTLGVRYFQIDSTGPVADFMRWRVASATGDTAALSTFRARFSQVALPSLLRISGTTVLDGIQLQDADSAFAFGHAQAELPQVQAQIAYIERDYRLNRGQPSKVASLDSVAAAFFPFVKIAPIWDALYADGDTMAARAALTRLKSLISGKLVADPARRSEQYGAMCATAVWRLAHGDTLGLRPLLDRLAQPLLPSAAIAEATQSRACGLGLRASLAAESGSPDAKALAFQADSLMNKQYFPPALMFSARVHEEMGDTTGALAVVRRRIYHWATTAYLAPLLREEGRLAALTGDREGAIRAYQHYLRLREGAEPGLQPQIALVRDELSKLVAEP